MTSNLKMNRDEQTCSDKEEYQKSVDDSDNEF